MLNSSVQISVMEPANNIHTEGCAPAFALSLEELYQNYYPRVFRICFRMTRNVADAEDLAHDAILQIYRTIGSFRGQSSITSWLHRIVINQVLMYFRKSSTRNERTTESGDMPERIDPRTDRRDNHMHIDRIALAAAINQLPRGYRQVFLLHDVEGYEHEEIGRILGVSSGTSKSQLHKARMRLRELLKTNKPVSELAERRFTETVLA